MVAAYVNKDITETINNIYIPSNPKISKDIVFSIGTSNDKYPILLVPGIMGSARNSNSRFSPFPGLPPQPCDDGSNLHIHAPLSVGWATLTGKALIGKDHLQEKGYILGKNLFEVPYDWRMGVHDIAEKFLIPAVNNAKQKTGKDKVSIIAHSMGGLVVRAYIQGDHNYSERNDIHRFAMVGTPNKGSSTAYYLWEGGDPLLADNIVGGGWPLNFYSNTTQKNYKITFGNTPPATQTGDFYSYYHGNIKKDDNPIEGLKQLLPTYGFLGHDSKNKLSDENKNKELYNLNEGDYADKNSFMEKPGSAGDKIGTMVFAGTGEETISTIDVGSANRFYADGQPVPIDKQEDSAEFSNGDGTVLKDSALWPDEEGWAEGMEKPGKHGELIGTFADELVTFIDSGTVISSQRFSQEVSTLEEEKTVLSISITGNVRLYLTNPDSESSGIDPVTNNRVSDISGTEMALSADGGYIDIQNPVEGLYRLQLIGGKAGMYNLELSYTDGSFTDYIHYMGFNHGDTSEIQFNLTWTSQNQKGFHNCSAIV